MTTKTIIDRAIAENPSIKPNRIRAALKPRKHEEADEQAKYRVGVTRVPASLRHLPDVAYAALLAQRRQNDYQALSLINRLFRQVCLCFVL